jgi:hypothetical protein
VQRSGQFYHTTGTRSHSVDDTVLTPDPDAIDSQGSVTLTRIASDAPAEDPQGSGDAPRRQQVVRTELPADDQALRRSDTEAADMAARQELGR